MLLFVFAYSSCIKPGKHVFDVRTTFDSYINGYRRIPQHARGGRGPPEEVFWHQAIPSFNLTSLFGLINEPITIAAPESK